MDIDILSIAIFAILGAAAIGLVFRLVFDIPKHSHPMRQIWLSFAVTLFAVVGLPVALGVMCVRLLSALEEAGIDLGHLGVVAATGIVLGTSIGAWEICRAWMSKPPSTPLS